LGLAWGLAQFTVDFMPVGVREKLVQAAVGLAEFADVLGGQAGHAAFLPIVVAAFDFAFGLERWGIEELDAIAVEGLAPLGEGVRIVGVEEGVVVHVEDQRQAVGLEDAREEIQVGQEGFAGVEARPSVEAGGVVEDVQEDLLVGVAGPPRVRGGVILPERDVIAGLPAFDGFACGLAAGVGVKWVFDGPAADTGAVSFEVEAAVQFAGGSAVGSGWLGGEKFGEEGRDVSGPVGVMITARETGRPDFGEGLSAGLEVVAVEPVEVRAREARSPSGGLSRKLLRAMHGQEMANEGGGNPFDQLYFFIIPR
jgi:hypothetical protein